jgi:LytR cell envelope-related transcriptional attenuator
VDHPLQPDQFALVRPWRLAALVAGSIAALELLILLAIGGGALIEALSSRLDVAARQHALAPPKKDTPNDARERSKPEPAKLPRAKTIVLVLNGNGRTGAAAAAAGRVKRDGYKIGAVGNAPRTDFAHDLVMFRPGFAGEGRRLARDFGTRRVAPLDGIRIRELGRAHAVIVLGA